ncbi:MAG: GNAT family N-acetyltransferase [Acidimicrobiales bacterium]
MRWEGPHGCWASDDKALVDTTWVHASLTGAYWALGRSYDVVAKSIENSLVVGLYSPGGAQIGIARVVTDFATFGWLSDVFVEPSEQGRGLGTFLVQTTAAHPAVQGVRLVLAATPGRNLYAAEGFVPLGDPQRWMERKGLA